MIVIRAVHRLLILLLILVPLLLSAGCTANYVKNVSADALRGAHLLDSHRVQRSQEFTLHRGSKIYLKSLNYSERSSQFATPAPAYPKKQALLEQTLLKNLRVAFPQTLSGESGTNLQDAFIEASAMQAEFLFFPWFANSNDQLSTVREMSEGRGIHEDRSYGLDDSLFTLVIFDVYTQRMLDTVQVYSTAHWFASEHSLQTRLQDATRIAVQHISSM